MEKPISDELRQKLRERASKGGKAGSHESKVKAGRLGFRAMFRALTGTEYQPKETNT